MNLSTYLREQLPTEATAAELLASYVADERNWQNVQAATINRWLGAKGRELDLSAFAATVDKQADSELVYELKGAIRTLLRSLTLEKTSISLRPGHKDRQLIDSLPVLSQVPESGLSITTADIGELITTAYLGEQVTEADVTAALALIARTEAANAANNANDTALSKARQINQASIDDTAVQRAYLDEPATPDGYEWTNGVLRKAGD